MDKVDHELWVVKDFEWDVRRILEEGSPSVGCPWLRTATLHHNLVTQCRGDNGSTRNNITETKYISQIVYDKADFNLYMIASHECFISGQCSV